MITLKVYKNGELKTTGGSEDLSVLSAIISAVGKLGKMSKGTKANQNDYNIGLSVVGLTSRPEPQNNEHIRWSEVELTIGDEVNILIGEEKTSDSPISTEAVDKDDNDRKQYEWAKDYYFSNRSKYDK